MAGRTGMSGESLTLYAYGLYLSNGGTKENFLDLTPEDIQIIVSTDLGIRKRSAQMTANAIGKTLFKGDRE